MDNKDFKILGGIAKAHKDSHGRHLVTGIASGVQVDRDNERMAFSAIDAMKRAIEQGIYNYEGEYTQVPLIAGHDQEWDRHLGWVIDAEIDGEYNLIITAELDPLSPNAMALFQKLNRPREVGRPLRLGFSIGGRAIETGLEIEEFTHASRLVFYDIALKEMTVTGFPAYAPSYLTALAKSINIEALRQRHEQKQEQEEQHMGKQSTQDETEAVVENAATEAVVEVVEKHDDIGETEERAVEVAPEVVEHASESAGVGEEEDVPASSQDEEISEETTEEPVTKSEEAADDASDSVSVLAADVAKLTIAVADLMQTVDVMKAQIGQNPGADAQANGETEEQVATTDATKSAEADDAGETVAKSEDAAEVDIADLVKNAFSDALAPLMERVEALEAQPVDKSLAVSTHEEEEEDALTKFRKELGSMDSKSIIKASLLAAGYTNDV